MLNYDSSKSLFSVQSNLIEKYGSALSVDDVAKELKVESTDVEYLLDSGELSYKIICDKKRIMITSLIGYIFNICPPTIVESPNKENHKVNDILDIVLENKKKENIRLATYVWYTGNAKHIKNAFYGKFIEDITANEILTFLKGVSKNSNGKLMSSRFLQVITSLLKNTVLLAIKKGYISKNPFNEIYKLPKGKKGSPKERVLSKGSVIKLYNVLNKSPTFKPMIILMLRSGLRIGEVLALRWTDVDSDKGVIHVAQGLSLEYDEDIDGNPINRHYEIGTTKTVCSVRDVTVDSKVFEALDEWKQYIASKPHMKLSIAKKGNQNIVFVNKSGDIRSYQALRKSFKRFLIANGLGDIPITFHRFRHTYATLLSDSGVDINIIRDMLGHKDIETTANIYVSVNLAPKRKATKMFESTINEIVGNS